MAQALRHSTKPYHLKLFFSNRNTHAQVTADPAASVLSMWVALLPMPEWPSHPCGSISRQHEHAAGHADADADAALVSRHFNQSVML